MHKFKIPLLAFGGLLALVGVITVGTLKTSYGHAHPAHRDAVSMPACAMEENVSETGVAHAPTSVAVTGLQSNQVCYRRMGCKCKHGGGNFDTLRKHHPEDNPFDDQNTWNPHLDIKCTRCNSRQFWCPVFKRYQV